MRICLYNLHFGGTGRADPLAEVLLAQTPDVVLLTEAEDPDVLARLAWRLGMEAITDGSAAALVARHVTVAASLHYSVLPVGQGWRGLLGLQLASAMGDMRVVVADATERPARGGELVWPDGLLEGATPLLVAGTFEGAHCALLDQLTASGLSDSDAGPTFPTQHPVARPDRVVTRGLVVRAVRVETDRLATYASDHYPIVAELGLT